MHRHPLISAQELAARLRGGPSQVPLLLDVRWRLGADDGYDAYLQGHLPGAVFVDLERDLSGAPGEDGRGGRHPMPSVDDFELDMAECGVDNERLVVVYDDCGSIAAARCWWLLRHFGKYDVQVLDGGLAAWRAERLPVESGLRLVEEGDFSVRRSPIHALDADQAALYAREGLLVDARPAERFHGRDETVDPVAGHIPGAVNVPTAANLEEDGTFRSPEALRGLYAEARDRRVAAYCGSGVTAAHDILAMEVAGIEAALYPGSWSEWVTDPRRPVATVGD